MMIYETEAQRVLDNASEVFANQFTINYLKHNAKKCFSIDSLGLAYINGIRLKKSEAVKDGVLNFRGLHGSEFFRIGA